MIGVEKTQGINEIRFSQAENVKEIKPTGNITPVDARSFWTSELSGPKRIENYNQDIKHLISNYFADIVSHSECPETLPEKPFEISDIKPRTAEQNREYREQFDDVKKDLREQWETVNNQEWPKYEQDVYSAGGKLIHQKGDNYDAHHILPLCLGGKNEVNNITPLHAEVHYDHQGVHSPDSPFRTLVQRFGGSNND